MVICHICVDSFCRGCVLLQNKTLTSIALSNDKLIVRTLCNKLPELCSIFPFIKEMFLKKVFGVFQKKERILEFTNKQRGKIV